MNDQPIATFQKAIRATHGVEAELASRERVHETYEGETVWEGEVLVFELQGHPTALRCYAWEVDGRVTAVLHEPPVDSPVAAVRAAIVYDDRAERERRGQDALKNVLGTVRQAYGVPKEPKKKKKSG